MKILGDLIGPVTGLLDKFIEDKDQKAALAHEIATMSEKHGQEIALQQIEVLKLDAKGQLVPIELATLSRLLLRTGLIRELLSVTALCGVRH